MPRFEARVHIFQEIQCVAIHTARRVALPVDQAADCIHAQTVKMELIQPIVGRGLQKAAHFAARMDEIAAAPLAFAYIRMGIFIKRRAVK